MTTKELKAKLKAQYTIDESDIDWIICEVMSIKRSQINMPILLNGEQEQTVLRLAFERQGGRPLAYILGKSNFYGRDFSTREGCLIPRCETEELVECVLKKVKQGKGLEIGIGSGAISITLALENQNIKMQGVDISDDALAIAKENAVNLNADVIFYKSDIYSNVKAEDFDFIVSNPPYISSDDIEKLDFVVKNFEPRLALDGGTDGLEFYRKIIDKAPQFLNKKGKLFFEIGIDEAESIKELLKANFGEIQILKDLEGVERIIYATLKD